MTLGHPLVDAALDDLRLSPLQLRVFRVLWRSLDFREFREQKTDVIAHAVRCDRGSAGKSLLALTQYGYIEEGERTSKGVGTYRLAAGVPTGGPYFTTSAPAPRSRRQVSSGL